MQWEEIVVLCLFVADVAIGIAIFFLDPLHDFLTWCQNAYKSTRRRK